MSATANDPEQRWRRTVEQRGRPLKLKVGRLLKDFGYDQLTPEVAGSVEHRLAVAGLEVVPSLGQAGGDGVVALAIASAPAPGAPAPDPAAEEPSWLQPPSAAPPPQPPAPAPPQPAPPPPPTPQPPAPAPQPPAPQPPAQQPAAQQGEAPSAATPPPPPGSALDELEQSLLVRAAVEAERRVREAYDRAQAAAAGRIARLERELAAEREATARAREERNDLERRMHAERREAAARLQAMAEAERAARALLESQREELVAYRQHSRMSASAIGQARETLEEVRAQVGETSGNVRDTLGGLHRPDPDADAPEPPGEPGDAGPEAEHHEDPAGEAGARDDVLFDDDLDPYEDAPAYDAEPGHAAEAEEDDGWQDTPSLPAGALPGWAAPADGTRDEPRRRRSGPRLRRRSHVQCAVCGTAGGKRDPERLTAAGWVLTDSAALCPNCVAGGWRLSEDDPVPFRPHDAR